MLRMKIASLVVGLTLVLASTAHAESATYYADAYAGGVTASGDTYDPGAYTAAHPSLPLGTSALVCAGDACVTVVINDRCACGIDLSRAAAADLGLLDAGRLDVSVTAL